MYWALPGRSARSSLGHVHRRALGFLFTFLAFAFVGIAVAAAGAGGRAWVVAIAAAALGLWLGTLALKAFGLR